MGEGRRLRSKSNVLSLLGIYDYSWSASTLRWISVHLSLEVSKEVLGFCDVEYELDGKLIEPSCFTRTEYKASSTNYLKRTLRRIALAPNLVDSDGYEQQQQQKWVEDHDGDQDGVLVLDTPLPIQEKGDRRSMRTSHHKSGGFKKEALGFGGIDEDDNVNGGGGNRKFTKSVKSSSSSSVRRNVILKTDSPLVIVPSTNPPPSSFPQPHIIPSSSSLSFSSSSSSSSTFSKTSSSSELLKLQSDKNKVMNDLLKLAGATPQRLEGDKTIEDEATRRMHGHAVDNLDEHTRNGGKAIDSENNKRGEGVVGGAERRQEPANLIDPGRSNNANSMGDVRGRRVEPIIVAGGGAAGLGGEQQQQQNEQQHQQKHQQPQQPQQSPLSRKINEGGGGEHESDASLREQYAKEEEQRYYAHAGLGGASLVIEEEEEEQEEKDDDENDEIIFGAGGVGDDHAAAAPLVERPRPEVIAIQRN